MSRDPILIEARDVIRRFGETIALDGVSLTVEGGYVHALLGPNGAGKTTLLRAITGFLTPSSGTVTVLGADMAKSPRSVRQVLGFVPSGDRTFYLRISGLENLVFFARLHGLRRTEAVRRAREVLAQVGLAGAAAERVGVYSHGMQKRLSFARALITDPQVFLVDEATHDLDPEGARRVRELAARLAERGAAVLWATQRLDEIRGFSERVTLLHRGRVRFDGAVPDLIAHALPRSYHVCLTNGTVGGRALERLVRHALGDRGRVVLLGEGSEHFHMALGEHVVLGEAIAALQAAGLNVITCREERSGIEEAFLLLTQEDGP